MAEFKLGRIRFVWKNAWAAATEYFKDDVVRLNGRTYVCVLGHTSSSDFNVDLEASPTKWNVMADGISWQGSWDVVVDYNINDLVKYGGNVYICIDAHTSAATTALGLEQDQAKWELFVEGIDWKYNWSINTRYKVNDAVVYGGIIYICNTYHTSASTIADGLELDQAKWDTFAEGFDFKNTWTTTTRYKVNDIVRYGPSTYVCLTAHTSTTFASDVANWTFFAEGFSYESTWSSLTEYQPGDIVSYGGNQYVSIQTGQNQVPTTATAYWVLFSQGLKFISDYSISTSYKIGEVIRLGGFTYLAASDIQSTSLSITATSSATNYFTVADTSDIEADLAIQFTSGVFGNVFTNATYYVKQVIDGTNFTISQLPGGVEFVPTTGTGTMAATVSPQPPNTTYWNRLNGGIRWRGDWDDDVQYLEGDVVKYGSNSYYCTLAHRSEGDDGSTIGSEGGGAPNSRPDQDITGTYWGVFALGNEIDILSEFGDLVYFGGNGPTRLPVGRVGQILGVQVIDNIYTLPTWITPDASEYSYYVAAHGEDRPAPANGLSVDRPWKTIRFACEQIEKGVRNPDAQKLLELNRAFIQKEVTEWIQYQIANDLSPFTSSFDYDEYKCERDTGYLIDAFIHDIGHGGNVKTRGAANAFVGGLIDSPGTYATLSTEKEEDIAAWTYMLSVITAVLDQTAPAVNYQVLNGDNSTTVVEQYTSSALRAESTAITEITSLLSIIVNALNAESPDDIPARYLPNSLISVKTGRYREVLPIIVPENTCILGEEVRSTNAGPAGSLIDITDAAVSLAAIDRFTAIVGDIVEGNAVTASTGNTLVQSQDFPFADSTQTTALTKLLRLIKYRIDWDIDGGYVFSLTDPTNYNTSYLVGYGDARRLIKENRKFFQEEIRAYLNDNYPTLKYSRTTCLRDVGYIIDSLVYDLTYGGNAMSVVAGLAYYEGVGSSLYINSTELTATIQAYLYLKTIVTEAAVNTDTGGLQTTIAQYKDTAGSAAAATLLGNNIDEIIDIIQNGPSAATLTDPSTAWVAAGLTGDYSTLSAQFTNIANQTATYVTNNYPDLTYNVDKCKRDVETILKAVGYDFMFNSNYQTLKAAHAYLRETALEVYTLNQKAATRAALIYARDLALTYLIDATAQSRTTALFLLIDDILYGATTEGDNCASGIRNDDYACHQLEINKPFIIQELVSYTNTNYTTDISNSVSITKTFTCTSTSWMVRNMAIRFRAISPSTFTGGLSADSTYYVQKIISSTEFAVAATRFATDAQRVEPLDSIIPFRAVFYYEEASCRRDVTAIIDAIKYDKKFIGNYKSTYAALYYANGVKGSLEENMYLVRSGTGIRNQTLEGLTGDLTPENAYGTSRVTSGAYVSLDPGWGPDDYRVWITERSCYVQNVSTFGYAAIGQKIDGALHNGGNDSIVSNDFTQLISDGIGAWVENNGRAELVSVFTYYSHVGYLATNGGRIRATNGNNSYGDFGAVAEGFDTTETPNTAIVDNRFQYRAVVGSMVTDATNDIYIFEFDHAGNDYTEATWAIQGAGTGATVEQDEFRDGGVFQVRLLDLVDDSTDSPADGNFGGSGYISNSNTAQGGSSTSLTFAATDPQNSGDYIGMKVFLTGGSGAGQYAIVSTYNSGTKVANVVKESDGSPGWEHVIPAYGITNPDASTTYTVEPALSFTAPPVSKNYGILPSLGTWTDVIFGSTSAAYTGVSGSYSGSGATGATFDVIRNGYKYIVSVNTGGTGYTRLETITIPGTSLGGLSTDNDLELIITAVNSLTGEILEFDQEGYGRSGIYVACKTGSQQGATSVDGINWTDRATMLPSGANWSALGFGVIDDGSTNQKISRFVAVATGSTAAAYSDDGVNWFASTMPTSANWVDVTYGEGKFVAVASDSTVVAISLDGVVWDITGTLTTTGFTSVAYGAGVFVAVKTGSDVANYSSDAITWTASTLPASAAWNSITYGKQQFIAIASDSNSGAISLYGETWSAISLGSVDSTTAGYQKIEYGQGVYVASAYQTGLTGFTWVNTSEDGIIWTPLGLEDDGAGYAGFNALTFGTPDRVGKWIVLPKDPDDVYASFSKGARAKARAFVSENRIFNIRIHEPGSGYTDAPTLTITDPNNTFEAPTQVRVGDGVLGSPSVTNRGTGYLNADAVFDTGDGYADFFQTGTFLAVRRITQRPVAGSNVVLGHLPNRTFKLVSVVTFIGLNDGAYTAFFQISPELTEFDAPPDGTSVTTRLRYSQVRMTGHDFLDIGTGNFVESNYPGEPTQPPIQANETVESNGGRVFFTSTDQDGNFRVGDLFSVEQSTGIATLNADAFNIAGLQELTLGEVTLGGGSATVTEFSTDPFFSADSDTVVPTQRAIKAYISAQIGGGGAALNVNSVTAGFIQISGNTITTTGGQSINMSATFNFTKSVRGIPNAWNYFLR